MESQVAFDLRIVGFDDDADDAHRFDDLDPQGESIGLSAIRREAWNECCTPSTETLKCPSWTKRFG